MPAPAAVDVEALLDHVGVRHASVDENADRAVSHIPGMDRVVQEPCPVGQRQIKFAQLKGMNVEHSGAQASPSGIGSK